MDFPSSCAPHRPVISSFGPEALGVPLADIAPGTGNLGGNAAWPSAGLALFVPFRLRAPYLVRTLWWANGGTAAGNVDCGVYSPSGALILSKGATAQAGTSVIQAVTPTATLLRPGSYLMALAMSSGSATAFRVTGSTVPFLQLEGCAQMASAEPLPASATLATISNAFFPLFGIANATVI